MNLNIEFLYFRGCPNHEAARRLLVEVLRENRIKVTLHNMRIDSRDEAVAKRFLGSPTIRINGRDVDPSAEHRADFGMQCRVYLAGGTYTGMPSKEMIRAALLRFTESRNAGQRALADSAAPTANAPRMEPANAPTPPPMMERFCIAIISSGSDCLAKNNMRIAAANTATANAMISASAGTNCER